MTIGFTNLYVIHISHIVAQEISNEIDVKVKKYMRGEGANLEV